MNNDIKFKKCHKIFKIKKLTLRLICSGSKPGALAKADGEGVPTDGDLLGENGVDAVEECLAELKAGMNFWELGKHIFFRKCECQPSLEAFRCAAGCDDRAARIRDRERHFCRLKIFNQVIGNWNFMSIFFKSRKIQ